MKRAVFFLLILMAAAFARDDVGTGVEGVYTDYQDGIERVIDKNYKFLRYALPVEAEVWVGRNTYVFVAHMDGRTEFRPGESTDPDFILELTPKIVGEARDSDKLHANLPDIGFKANSFKGRIIKAMLEMKLNTDFKDVEVEAEKEGTRFFDRILDIFR